jgi:hypothetical protein
MGLAGPGATDEDDVALMGQEVAAGEIVDQRLVDRPAVEGEVGDVLATDVSHLGVTMAGIDPQPGTHQ